MLGKRGVTAIIYEAAS